jgi:hypothetical protein
LRNVKLFRAVMHDELESAYWITRLMLNGQHCLVKCTTSTTWCLCSLSTTTTTTTTSKKKSNQANKFHFFSNH